MERITRRPRTAADAASRIGLALLVSAALHLLFIVRIEVGGPRPDDSPPSIHARLNLESSPASPPSPPIRTPVQTAPAPLSSAVALPPAIEQPGASPQVENDRAVDAPGETIAEPEAIRAPVDPVYYTARELDVYPVPIEPLRARATVQAQGRVRVLAMVDETGQVTQAEVFDSDPQEVFDAVALQAVRTARFSPARKDGRAVRSRVLIELSFEVGKED